MMVRHAAVALACLALAHAIAAPAAFCPKVLEPLDRDSDECPDELPLKRMTADQIDALMPFYDEGVRFSEIGAVLLAPTVKQVLRTVNMMTAAEMQTRRVRMKAVASLFTPKGTFSYMLRRTSRLA
mgnify:CR=1 FL=1